MDGNFLPPWPGASGSLLWICIPFHLLEAEVPLYPFVTDLSVLCSGHHICVVQTVCFGIDWPSCRQDKETMNKGTAWMYSKQLFHGKLIRTWRKSLVAWTIHFSCSVWRTILLNLALPSLATWLSPWWEAICPPKPMKPIWNKPRLALLKLSEVIRLLCLLKASRGLPTAWLFVACDDPGQAVKRS